MLEAFLVGIIDAFLLRKTMQFYSGVDTMWTKFTVTSSAAQSTNSQ